MSNWVDDILKKVANKDAGGFEKIKEMNDVCQKVAVDRMETLVKQDIPPAVAFIIAINAIESAVESGKMADLPAEIIRHYTEEWMAENGHWEIEV